MTHTDMTKPFSTNPKLADWVPSEQQIQTITATRELLELVPEEEGDSTNAHTISTLNVQSHLHPEVTDPQQLVEDTFETLIQNTPTYPVPNGREGTDAKTNDRTTLPPHLRGASDDGDGRLYIGRPRWVSRASGQLSVRGVGMCLEESGWDRSFLCTYSIQEAVVPLMPGALNPLRPLKQ